MPPEGELTPVRRIRTAPQISQAAAHGLRDRQRLTPSSESQPEMSRHTAEGERRVEESRRFLILRERPQEPERLEEPRLHALLGRDPTRREGVPVFAQSGTTPSPGIRASIIESRTPSQETVKQQAQPGIPANRARRVVTWGEGEGQFVGVDGGARSSVSEGTRRNDLLFNTLWLSLSAMISRSANEQTRARERAAEIREARDRHIQLLLKATEQLLAIHHSRMIEEILRRAAEQQVAERVAEKIRRALGFVLPLKETADPLAA